MSVSDLGKSFDDAIDAGLIKIGTVADIYVELRVSTGQLHPARVAGVPRIGEKGTVETWWYLTYLVRQKFPARRAHRTLPDALGNRTPLDATQELVTARRHRRAHPAQYLDAHCTSALSRTP